MFHQCCLPISTHALLGCDSVPKLFNIGKNNILKELGNEQKLHSLGTKSAGLDAVIKEA